MTLNKKKTASKKKATTKKRAGTTSSKTSATSTNTETSASKSPSRSTSSNTRSKSMGMTSQWVEKMNKDRKFKGKAQIKMASQLRTPYALRRPTGVLSLDIALGGGLHAGGAVELYGAQSAGKTFLMWRIFAQNQAIHGDNSRIVLLSTELRPDKAQARLAGCCIAYSEEEIQEMEDIRLANGQEPFTEEEKEDLRKEIGEIATIVGATADDALDVMVEALKAGFFQIAAIDSLGALLTKQVEEGSVGDSHYAGPSRVITQFQNKVWPLFTLDREDGSMLETTLLGINQVRSNIGGGRFDDSEKSAMGAWAWKHGQLLSLRLTKGGKLKDANDNFVGHKVRWDVKKGKAGTHDGKSGMYQYFHFPKMEPVFWKDVTETCYGGVGEIEDIVETAKDFGLLISSGAWLEHPTSGLRANGAAAFSNLLAKNPDVVDEIKRECLATAKISVRYK